METELISDVQTDGQERLISMAQFTPPQLTASQTRQLELFQHMAQYSELLLAVTGAEKAGKSFLARALIASREAPDLTVFTEADFSTGLMAILRNIARALDLEELPEHTDAAVRLITDAVTALDEGTVLLVIDQADQLDTVTLSGVSDLSLIAPDIFHIALFGRESLEEALGSLGATDHVHFSPVEPMTDEEAEVLLLGAFPEEEWQADHVDLLISLSEGRPGKLLDYAQAMLEGNLRLEAEIEQAVASSVKFPVTHLAALLLVASALVVSYLYSSSEKEPDILSLPAEAGKSEISNPALTISSEDDLLAGTETDTSEAGAATDGTTVAETDSAAEEVDFNFIEPVPVVSASAASETVAEESNTGPSAAEKAAPADLKPEVVVAAKPVAETVRSEQKSEPVTASTISYTTDEKILLATPSDHYVVQLFGSYKEDSARRFIRDHRETISGALVYQTTYKDKPWYVVVTGPYSSRNQGSAAVSQMPEDIRRQKPWIRSVASVKQAVRN